MRILIIDDDPDEMELFEASVREDNLIKFLQAGNCDEAFLKIKQGQPELVILDIHLGPDSGIACCKALKSDSSTAQLPVVMFSSSKSERHIDACYEAGADFFFVKPESLAEIAAVLDKVVLINPANNKQVNRDAFVISSQ